MILLLPGLPLSVFWLDRVSLSHGKPRIAAEFETFEQSPRLLRRNQHLPSPIRPGPFLDSRPWSDAAAYLSSLILITRPGTPLGDGSIPFNALNASPKSPVC